MADIGAPRRMLIVREREAVVPAILEPLGDEREPTTTDVGDLARPVVAERGTNHRRAPSTS